MTLRPPPGAEFLELRAAIARTRVLAIECGLAFTEVDTILDVLPGTFRAMCAEAPPAHPAEARIRILADALDYAARLLGGRGYVACWLRTPHPAMDGLSPLLHLTEFPECLRSMRDTLRGEWETAPAPRGSTPLHP